MVCHCGRRRSPWYSLCYNVRALACRTGPAPGTNRKGSQAVPILDIRVGDVYRMRKPHPCGSYEWRGTRIGAAIGMGCLGCGRRVLLPRSTFERRAKTLRSRVDPAATESTAAEDRDA